jgi:hypothetical protein
VKRAVESRIRYALAIHESLLLDIDVATPHVFMPASFRKEKVQSRRCLPVTYVVPENVCVLWLCLWMLLRLRSCLQSSP